jgi:hypothetical protein
LEFTSNFLDPFKSSETQPLEELPPNVYRQLPENEMTYAYTPTLSVSQLEAQTSSAGSAQSSPFFHSFMLDPALRDSTPSSDLSNNAEAVPLNTMVVDPTPTLPLRPPRHQKPASGASSHSAAPISTIESDYSPVATRHYTPTLPHPSTSAAPIAAPRFSTPHASNSAVHHPQAPMAIPKAVTHKLVHQETRIMGLEARIEQDGRLIAALQTSETRLQHEIDDLDNENTQLLKKLQGVETVIDQQTRDIDRLFLLLEQKPSAQVPPDADKTKKPRDNVFNVSAAFITIW